MNTFKDKGILIILISAITLFSNLGGLLISKFAFESPNNGDSSMEIFDIICGVMILISVSGLFYGISLRKKN